jgi:hypothetical protein
MLYMLLHRQAGLEGQETEPARQRRVSIVLCRQIQDPPVLTYDQNLCLSSFLIADQCRPYNATYSHTCLIRMCFI